MRCRVELFAGLRERAGTASLEVDGLPERATVADLKRALERARPDIGGLTHVRAVLGTNYVDDGAALADGAVVHLLPPVSGGADAYEAGVFELRADALDPGDALRRVGHPACGGSVVFVGTTRERNRERDVTRLDYEAFGEMCGPEMARLFERCLAEHGPPSAADASAADELRLRMLVQHRTGVVDVGEPSVVVAVASPHRDAAFRAARFLIDELKASLPVWKKECYGDGHHWIGEGA
ncbi:MAG: molybdenum cofactor biosynthesis protein MoaE [Planctomycetota bacterium]